jgi:integrase
LKNDLTINQWMETINPKKNTIKAYLIAMQEYTEYTKKSPTELIDEAELEVDNRVKMRNCKIWHYLIGFRTHLQNKGLAPITVRNYMAAVKSFYKSLFIQVPPLPRISKARTLKENNSIPSKEDLQEVLKVCDPLEKAVLLTGVSSGLSANEIINLTVLDFKKGYDSKTGITILIYAGVK